MKNMILIVGLFLAFVILAISIEIYDPILEYLRFVIIIVTLVIMINFMLKAGD